MKIAVSEIPDEGLEVTDEKVIWDDDQAGHIEATLNVNLQKIGDEVLVRGDVSAMLHHVCSNCLVEFDAAVDTELELVYRPAQELEAGEAELELAELDTGFYRDDEIDLDDLTREQVILNLPMKPLCDEDCKGICPTCGVNRNETQCDCVGRRIDPRLAVLEKLKKGKE